MARIRHIDKGNQEVKVHPTEVDCSYQIISTPNGENLLHLSTFGSDSRATHPKSSQSMQLDRRAAEQLVEVMRRAFPGLIAP